MSAITNFAGLLDVQIFLFRLVPRFNVCQISHFLFTIFLMSAAIPLGLLDLRNCLQLVPPLNQQQQSQPDNRNGSGQWQGVPLVSNPENFSGQGKNSSSTSQQSREQSTSPITNAGTQMDTSIYASASYVQNQQYYSVSTVHQYLFQDTLTRERWLVRERVETFS